MRKKDNETARKRPGNVHIRLIKVKKSQQGSEMARVSKEGQKMTRDEKEIKRKDKKWSKTIGK